MDRHRAVELGAVADALARVVADPAVDRRQRVVRDELPPRLPRAGLPGRAPARPGCSPRPGNRRCTAAADRGRPAARCRTGPARESPCIRSGNCVTSRGGPVIRAPATDSLSGRLPWVPTGRSYARYTFPATARLEPTRHAIADDRRPDNRAAVRPCRPAVMTNLRGRHRVRRDPRRRGRLPGQGRERRRHPQRGTRRRQWSTGVGRSSCRPAARVVRLTSAVAETVPAADRPRT